MLLKQLIFFIQHGSLIEVKRMVERVDPCQASSDESTEGETPLFIAASYGHIEIVKYLVKEKNAIPSALLRFGRLKGLTPLYMAAANGHLPVVKYLVEEENLSPHESVSNEISPGESPVYIASTYGHIKLVDYFIGLDGVNLSQICKGLVQHHNDETASDKDKKSVAFLFYKHRALLDALENIVLPDYISLKTFVYDEFATQDQLLIQSWKETFDLELPPYQNPEHNNSMTYTKLLPELRLRIWYHNFRSNVESIPLSFDEFSKNNRIITIRKDTENKFEQIEEKRAERLIEAIADELYNKILNCLPIDKISGVTDRVKSTLLNMFKNSLIEKKEAIMPYFSQRQNRENFIEQYIMLYKEKPSRSYNSLFERTISNLDLQSTPDEPPEPDMTSPSKQLKQAANQTLNHTYNGFFAVKNKKIKRPEDAEDILDDERLFEKKQR